MPYPDDDLPVQPNTLLPVGAETGLGAALNPSLLPVLPVQPNMAPTVNPFADAARMLQGFAAGFQGRANPYIAYEQRAQALEQQRQADVQQQQMRMLQLQETQRARATAEKRAEMQDRRDEEAAKWKRIDFQMKLAADAIDFGVKSGSADQVAGGLRMRRDLGLPGPQTDAEILSLAGDRVALEMEEKKGKTWAATALLGRDMPGLPPRIKEMAATPEGRALLMSTYKIDDPAEHLNKIKLQGEDLATKQFERTIKQEELTLGSKSALSPLEQARLDAIRAFRGHDAKSDTMRLAQEYQKGGMPLELALPKAARELAQSKDKDTNMEAVIAEAMKNNPQLSRGQAVLMATNAMNAARKGFDDQEQRLESMKQVVGQIEDYSKKVHLYDSLAGRAIQQGKSTVGTIFGTDYARNVAGLERQLAYLGNIMRELGEKGVISDRDITRGTALINPSVWTMASTTKDSIAELKQIIARGEGRLEAQKKAAFNPGSVAQPKGGKADPLNLFGGGG